jgi:hypothetical protein
MMKSKKEGWEDIISTLKRVQENLKKELVYVPESVKVTQKDIIEMDKVIEEMKQKMEKDIEQ